MSIPFLLATLALLAIVIFFLLRPLLRPRPADQTTRQAMNSAIYRTQLRELESDLQEGSLTPAAFEEAQRELQRRLLNESDNPEPAPAPAASRRTAIALLILLPLASASLYAWLGAPQALSPFPTTHEATSADLEKMVDALAARLEENPDDLAGWAMLARSYKAMQRFEDAEKAFARLGDSINEDAGLLASYADLLGARANSLEGRPLALVEKALQLDPAHSMSLSLAGTAAYHRKDFATAVQYWERLLKTLPPESEEADGIAAVIERLRRENKLEAPPAKTVSEKPATATAAVLRGRVELDKAAAGKAAPQDTVFIMARPAEGGKMPLAAKRITVADLPYEFALDDSLAMMSGVKLSEAEAVVVEARISRSGDVKASPGDWVGRSQPVKPGATGLRIRIDEQIR